MGFHYIIRVSWWLPRKMKPLLSQVSSICPYTETRCLLQLEQGSGGNPCWEWEWGEVTRAVSHDRRDTHHRGIRISLDGNLSCFLVVPRLHLLEENLSTNKELNSALHGSDLIVLLIIMPMSR
jgi:hypothetical protein